MRKRVRAPEKKQRTTVFLRIVSRLCLPLLFLGTIFTAIQLESNISILNELHGIQGQIAFEKVYDQLTTELAQIRSSKSDLTDLKKTMHQLRTDLSLQHLYAFDLLNREPLFHSNASLWTPFDYSSMEESLYQQHLGKKFIAKVNRMNHELIAYIPLEGIEQDQVIVVKAAISLTNLRDVISLSKWQLSLVFLVILVTGVLISRSLSHAIVKPITLLKQTTQEIMKGKLGKHVYINTGDEIEVLAHTFNHMSDTIKQIRKQAEDSNPLTQLPGNQGIYHELNQRIYERRKFVLFHADIDRFKLFNDHFGLARGDQVIKHTADILKKAVKAKGMSDDFVGHQGGDDFILITQPSHAQELGNYACELFDHEVRAAVYRKADLDRGSTVQLDRRRMAETGEKVTRDFPLISISLAGVSNARKDFSDYFTCMAAAVEVKKEAKDKIESICLIRA